MAFPKLETIFTFSSTQAVSVDEGGGAVAVNVAASATSYTHSTSTSLLSAIGTALTANGSLAGTYTLTLSATTGKVTISATGIGGAGNFALNWTSTTVRNVLGFTGNLSGAASYTGTEQAEYLWLPGVGRGPIVAADGSDGLPMSDMIVTVSPSGHHTHMSGNVRYEDAFDIRYVLGNKVLLEYETTVNESFETFWTSTIHAGLPIRYYPDATSTSNTVDWIALPTPKLPVTPVFEGWNGATAPFVIAFPVIKKVS